MDKLKYLLSIITLFYYGIWSLYSQQKPYPVDYFGPPLDIPLILSGNFGELRSNHFHSGIDIKTQGVEGKKIYATADGYVSRIKVSTGGYGKALYISHPNGYTTVYAHLQKYNDALEAYIKRNQYAEQSFEVEMFPPASAFPVKKGDVIAISGNSGGSLAPHLHFEIRETKSEKPVNPLFFGFDIPDQVDPLIRTISIYPLNDDSYVDGLSQRKDYPVIRNGSSYTLPSQRLPSVYGDIGFGVETFDLLSGAGNHCGIYTIRLFDNDRPVFAHEMDKFSFYETRYINAHIDYKKYLIQNRRTQRSYLLPNNQLSTYEQLKNRGIVSIGHGEEHRMRYEITDVYGNTTLLQFTVMGDSTQKLNRTTIAQPPSAIFHCKEKNSFQTDNVILYLPPNVLYEDLPFHYYVDDTLKGALTPTYRLHNEYVPLHSYMMVSVKATGLSERIKARSLLVSHTKSSGIYPEGGVWKGDYIVTKTRSFGGYTIMVDTIKPLIKPININFNEDMRNKWSIMIKISDQLAGIESYVPKVDGEWILMEYDPKRDMITHYFDGTIAAGRHTFELTVKDKVGNVSVYKTEFIR